MTLKNLENHGIMRTFTLKNLPDLDTCVLGALELFANKKLPKISIPYKKPLIVGSGNAEATGRIIFRDKDAVFADESDFENRLKKIKNIDGVILVSASGGKHAPIIAKCAKNYKKHITLITNTKHSPAEDFLDKHHKYDEYVLPKQKEPYTYNTSTYLSMILAKENENPKQIYEHIKKIKIPNVKKYDSFFLILPKEFDVVRDMLVTKFDELFGPKIQGRVYTIEQTKHAKTLVPSDKELFISFGEKNKTYGKNRVFVPLPKKCRFGGMIATAYYVIGKIQKQKPPYFKKNLVKYTKKASKIFKEEIKPIVE